MVHHLIPAQSQYLFNLIPPQQTNALKTTMVTFQENLLFKCSNKLGGIMFLTQENMTGYTNLLLNQGLADSAKANLSE